MFTVCPKCTLTLVVTTVDLRAGQGYVRCGRCANVFNALIALREGDPGGTVSDTANRRLQETGSRPPVNPAVGAGVADQEPEPEPTPEPEPDLGIEASTEIEYIGEPDPEDAQELAADSGAAADESGTEFDPAASESPDLVAEEDLVADEAALEFDATSTDVSEIFIGPEEERGSGSGNYEAVVLAVEPPAEELTLDTEPEPEPDLQPVGDDPSHTDTIAADDWSLLDDDELLLNEGVNAEADGESVVEESPLLEAGVVEEPVAAEDDTLAGPAPADPPWVDEMFAEAVEAGRARTGEHDEPPVDDVPQFVGDETAPSTEEIDEDAALVDAARASTGSAAPSDTVLEPLLSEPPAGRPAWHYGAGVAALGLLLVAQVMHFYRQNLVLNGAVGPIVSTVYGWFGAEPQPRWDLTAYSVQQLGAEAEGGAGTQLRVRLSLQNDSDRVQPLPLLRLTLQDRYGNPVATRDLEPREYLPVRAEDLRVLEPDQRIDTELQVIDPGRAAIGFEIDACLRGDGGAIGCAHDARRRAAS